MNGVHVVAALAVGTAVAAAATIVVPPTTRLARRVRPYTIVARAALGHAPDLLAPSAPATSAHAVGRLFGPPLRSIVDALGRAVERRGDEQVARLLRQAGFAHLTPDGFRIRQLGAGALVAFMGGVSAATIARSPLAALLAAGAGFTWGAVRERRRVERAVRGRAVRIRQELYTVNHLLAMHVRTGAGPIQAVQRVVDRGRGVVAEELAAVLASTRHGVGEADAFRSAAELTPEPSAARTYRLLAAGSERGADLGSALLSMSQDIRDARRDQLHKDAVRRRAAMLVPTIAILAPIMLLFVAAPMPSIVLGHR
ncbi:MAG: type II secretion system F family protein [Actinomycetota bacterium]